MLPITPMPAISRYAAWLKLSKIFLLFNTLLGRNPKFFIFTLEPSILIIVVDPEGTFIVIP
ncbi:hypothetical protein BSK47_26105 [Paenibacillus odorifer]|uniref:Uncharacterized protein n=1 Tax=Paenibacillus odorifer TaxID=189426 RepID=A0AB36J6E6_9BACL|nr:hypothetical protein BSK47_26105 [Paenibacillus odorifer]